MSMGFLFCNNEDPNDVSHHAASLQGLHCLSKYMVMVMSVQNRVKECKDFG